MNHPEWGEGPWNNEEDHAVWIDEITGLDCMINRGPSGALCGYVGVGPDHPAYGKHYDDVPVEVHGGLTYGAACRGEICHVPAEGREHDIWWLGFDCAHYNDLAPAAEASLRDVRLRVPSIERVFLEGEGTFGYREYRTWAWVTHEINYLAGQLKGMTDA